MLSRARLVGSSGRIDDRCGVAALDHTPMNRLAPDYRAILGKDTIVEKRARPVVTACVYSRDSDSPRLRFGHCTSRCQSENRG